MSEYKALSKTFGPMKDEVPEKLSRLHDGQLLDCTPHELFDWSNQEG